MACFDPPNQQGSCVARNAFSHLHGAKHSWLMNIFGRPEAGSGVPATSSCFWVEDSDSMAANVCFRPNRAGYQHLLGQCMFTIFRLCLGIMVSTRVTTIFDNFWSKMMKVMRILIFPEIIQDHSVALVLCRVHCFEMFSCVHVDFMRDSVIFRNYDFW